MKTEIYERVTNKIITDLEQGELPWLMPLTQRGGYQGSDRSQGFRFEGSWGMKLGLFLDRKAHEFEPKITIDP